jgi:transcriptional regulator with GAF, ATPase, and Fis domain
LQLDISGSDDSRVLTVLPELPAASGTQTERNFYTEKELKLQQRDNMRRALEFADWRIAGKGGAAELLGLKPSTLTDRMRTFGLSKFMNDSNKRAES